MHWRTDFSRMNVLSVINPKVGGQCGRCQMVGVDQQTGTRTKEPLMSLSAHRGGRVSQQQIDVMHVYMYVKKTITLPFILWIFRWLLVCTWPISYHRSPLQLPSSLLARLYIQSHTVLEVVACVSVLFYLFRSHLLSWEVVSARKDHLSCTVCSFYRCCSFILPMPFVSFHTSLFWQENNEICSLFSHN